MRTDVLIITPGGGGKGWSDIIPGVGWSLHVFLGWGGHYSRGGGHYSRGVRVEWNFYMFSWGLDGGHYSGGGMNGVKSLYVELESDGSEVFIMTHTSSCHNSSFEYRKSERGGGGGLIVWLFVHVLSILNNEMMIRLNDLNFMPANLSRFNTVFSVDVKVYRSLKKVSVRWQSIVV